MADNKDSSIPDSPQSLTPIKSTPTVPATKDSSQVSLPPATPSAEPIQGKPISMPKLVVHSIMPSDVKSDDK